jgi:hypothetical protein
MTVLWLEQIRGWVFWVVLPPKLWEAMLPQQESKVKTVDCSTEYGLLVIRSRQSCLLLLVFRCCKREMHIRGMVKSDGVFAASNTLPR